MKYIKINNFLHRYLGFFFVGAILVYAISGIALNHRDIWNPNYIINKREVKLNFPSDTALINKEMIKKSLENNNIDNEFLAYNYQGNDTLKLFLKNGTVVYNLKNNSGTLETAERRPFFSQLNFLHFGKKLAWKIFSDFFALSLIYLAVSGFYVRGRKDLTNKYTWITVALGIIIPIIYIIIFA